MIQPSIIKTKIRATRGICYSFYTTLACLFLVIHAFAQDEKGSSTVAGKIINVRGKVTIIRKGFKQPFFANTNFTLLEGDVVNVPRTADASALCYTTGEKLKFKQGNNVFHCSVSKQSRLGLLIDAFQRSHSTIREYVTQSGKQREVPRGDASRDCLVTIMLGRPKPWTTSIALRPLIGDDDRRQIIEYIDHSSGMDQDTQHLLKADVFAASALYEEAIEELRSFSMATQSSQIQIALGDLDLASNTPLSLNHAIAHYHNARKIAHSQGDTVAEVTARHALGVLIR